jgi:hypothetical protein
VLEGEACSVPLPLVRLPAGILGLYPALTLAEEGRHLTEHSFEDELLVVVCEGDGKGAGDGGWVGRSRTLYVIGFMCVIWCPGQESCWTDTYW